MHATKKLYVRGLLEDVLRLEARTYVGDYGAIVKLLDLECAVTIADLSDMQREVLNLYYIQGYTQGEIGFKLGGVSKQRINFLINSSIDKIAYVYEKWEEGEAA